MPSVCHQYGNLSLHTFYLKFANYVMLYESPKIMSNLTYNNMNNVYYFLQLLTYKEKEIYNIQFPHVILYILSNTVSLQ